MYCAWMFVVHLRVQHFEIINYLAVDDFEDTRRVSDKEWVWEKWSGL